MTKNDESRKKNFWDRLGDSGRAFMRNHGWIHSLVALSVSVLTYVALAGRYLLVLTVAIHPLIVCAATFAVSLILTMNAEILRRDARESARGIREVLVQRFGRRTAPSDPAQQEAEPPYRSSVEEFRPQPAPTAVPG